MNCAYRKDGRDLLLEDGDGQIILLFEPGSKVGMFHDDEQLLKHGHMTGVRLCETQLRQAMKNAGYQDYRSLLQVIEIEVEDITDETVAEMNACLNNAGRVVHLRDRLDLLRAPAFAFC